MYNFKRVIFANRIASVRALLAKRKPPLDTVIHNLVRGSAVYKFCSQTLTEGGINQGCRPDPTRRRMSANDNKPNALEPIHYFMFTLL